MGKNPKSQIRNPKQIPMTKRQNSKQVFDSVWDIGILNLEIVSDFEIRISDFPEGAVEWKHYNPSPGEQKKDNGRLNTASIGVLARSLMAREWARALGRKRRDPRLDAFERQAMRWREMKEAVERRGEGETRRREERD
jgi:hypothetical protein